jgi:hypothetical protein
VSLIVPSLAAEWSAGGVDDCWWDEVDVVGANEDVPAGVVHVAVVGLAEKNTVTESMAMCPSVTGGSDPGQANKLAVLLDALDGVVISSAERSSLHLVGRFRGNHRGGHRR